MQQSRSSSSVRIFSVDRDLVVGAVERFAQELLLRETDAVAVIWFGSWIGGTPTPGSDVDLCILLRSSPLAPRERIARYLPGGFPVGIDLFAYTVEEFALLARDSPGWYHAIDSGRIVAGELPSG